MNIPEGLVASGHERQRQFIHAWRAVQNPQLIQEARMHELRKIASLRNGLAGQRSIAGDQRHPIRIADRDFVNARREAHVRFDQRR